MLHTTTTLRAAAFVAALTLVLGLAPSIGAQDAGAPTIEWDFQDLWVVHHWMGKSAFEASACDPEGRLATLYFSAPGYGQGGFKGLPAGTSCYTLRSSIVPDSSNPATPSNFSATVTAKDADGNRVTKTAGLRYGILPLDTTTLPGFIDLSTLPAPKTWPAKLDLRVTPEGAIRTYKLTWDGKTQADTQTGTPIFPEDVRCQITITLALNAKSSVICGATPLYSNYFTHSGGVWWNVDPWLESVDVAQTQQSVRDTVFGQDP